MKERLNARKEAKSKLVSGLATYEEDKKHE